LYYIVFMVEDMHLIKCLQVSSSNEYLTFDFDGMPNSSETCPENFV